MESHPPPTTPQGIVQSIESVPDNPIALRQNVFPSRPSPAPDQTPAQTPAGTTPERSLAPKGRKGQKLTAGDHLTIMNLVCEHMGEMKDGKMKFLG